MKSIFLLIAAFIVLSIPAAHALEFEEGSDAPTRTIQDYIKDFVDVPKGATDWRVFGKTQMKSIEGKDADGLDFQYYKPVFTPDILALDGKEVTVKGFMFPLDETEDQNFFLFGPFPLNCPFQYHVQPNLVIEVKTGKKPVPFTYDPVTVTGKLELVKDDPDNSTFYRLVNARAVN